MSEQALIPAPQNPIALPPEPFYAFGSILHFEQAQRMAKALCSSSIVPDTYKGENRIGDCLIALEISNRIGANVLAVMQNLYIVHGKPAWSSQFLISCVNASRRFSPLRYKMSGTEGQDDWGCIAWATDKTGEVLESPKVTVGMAKAEGWYQKNGSKWKTLPELMLRYRAATFFTRLYAPEITMGIVTHEEAMDMPIDVTATVTSPALSFAATVEAPESPAPPKAAALEPAKSKAKSPKAHDTRKEPVAVPTPPAEPPVAESTPAPAASEPEPPKAPAEPVPIAPPTDMVKLREALAAHGIEDNQVLNWCKANNRLSELGDPAQTLEQLQEKTLAGLMKNVPLGGALVEALKKQANTPVTN